MRRHSIFLVPLLVVSILWMSVPQLVSAQEATFTPEPAGAELTVTVIPPAVGISSPGNGTALSGVVTISGTTLSAWTLSFSYADGTTDTWFPLAESADPISAGTLATWDTTAITDGFYILWLHVSAADGSQDFRVSVRVRNYSLIETATPTLTAAPTFTSAPISVTPTTISEGAATVTATFTPAASPTMPGPLPPNPATLNSQEIAVNFGKGVLGVAVLFAFFGLVLSLSRKLRA